MHLLLLAFHSGWMLKMVIRLWLRSRAWIGKIATHPLRTLPSEAELSEPLRQLWINWCNILGLVTIRAGQTEIKIAAQFKSDTQLLRLLLISDKSLCLPWQGACLSWLTGLPTNTCLRVMRKWNFLLRMLLFDAHSRGFGWSKDEQDPNSVNSGIKDLCWKLR